MTNACISVENPSGTRPKPLNSTASTTTNTITKSRSAESLAQDQQIMQMLLSYAALTPPQQKLVRPVLVSQLKKL